mmetsp:Transcript_148327/g.413178  ORF Transcript_148327/g.413178 Transcript_148327/m.413178 type:complete len:217 (+) Transcript_148327:1354-2004(+)
MLSVKALEQSLSSLTNWSNLDFCWSIWLWRICRSSCRGTRTSPVSTAARPTNEAPRRLHAAARLRLAAGVADRSASRKGPAPGPSTVTAAASRCSPTPAPVSTSAALPAASARAWHVWSCSSACLSASGRSTLAPSGLLGTSRPDKTAEPPAASTPRPSAFNAARSAEGLPLPGSSEPFTDAPPTLRGSAGRGVAIAGHTPRAPAPALCWVQHRGG